MVSGPDSRIRAARELLVALRKTNAIVLDAAAKEAAFRFQSGLLGSGEAAKIFEQLRILGWDGELGVIERAPKVRYRIIAACRLCKETFRADPLLDEDQVRRRARDLSPPKVTLHQDLFLPGESACLGIVTVQGLAEVHE